MGVESNDGYDKEAGPFRLALGMSVDVVGIGVDEIIIDRRKRRLKPVGFGESLRDQSLASVCLAIRCRIFVSFLPNARVRRVVDPLPDDQHCFESRPDQNPTLISLTS